MDSPALVTLVADWLSGDEAIDAIAGERILDFDYRTSGWNTAPVDVFDADGLMLPTIIVDDNGATQPFTGPRHAEEGSIFIWAFSTRSMVGHDDVETMMRLIRSRLRDWQEPVSRASLHWTLRLGKITADDGTYDRHTYRVGVVPTY